MARLWNLKFHITSPILGPSERIEMLLGELRRALTPKIPTQPELGVKIGVSKYTIGRIETTDPNNLFMVDIKRYSIGLGYRFRARAFDLNGEIVKHIVNLREAANLTQRALSRRSEISDISRMEIKEDIWYITLGRLRAYVSGCDGVLEVQVLSPITNQLIDIK